MSPVSALRAALNAAHKAQDWPAAAEAARRFRAAAPDDPLGLWLGARALRHLKRRKAADALSAEGVARFPEHPGILTERATLLVQQRRFEEAAACFGRLRTLRPGHSAAWVREADALIRLGRFDAAQAVLDHGLEALPEHVELLAQAAICAMRRQDFAAARARWDQVRSVAPNDIRLRAAEGGIDFAQQLDALDTTASPAHDLSEEATGAPDDAAILRRFDSLGGTCEFGLVQRAAGIEPLGLLRFTGITAPDLIAMLEAGLDGVGSPEHTRLSLTINNEYWLEDTRYFRTHTFLALGAVAEAGLLDKLCRRTAFLRDKLLAELRQGSKIMLFRPASGEIDAETMGRLHAAVRSYGGSPLLCVCDAKPGDEEVRLRDKGNGLLIGSMPAGEGKLSLQFVEQRRYALWLELCRLVVDQS